MHHSTGVGLPCWLQQNKPTSSLQVVQCVQSGCILAALHSYCASHLCLQQQDQGLLGGWVCSTSVSAVRIIRLCTCVQYASVGSATVRV
jgi:hypothetical protein